MTDPTPSGEERFEASIGTLRSQGERVTTARRLVLQFLSETDAHLSAEDLSEKIAEIAPSVHRATVYRTLDALTRLGLVAHVHLPHGAATYHLARPDERVHLHLACRSCERIIDTPADLLDDAAERLAESLGFVLDPEHVALTGWCENCRP